MSLAYYMDHHVPRVITQSLRARGNDVLTAFEDGADRLPDNEMLNRAAQLGRVLFTQDYDFLIEIANRQRRGEIFAGVIYAHQTHVNIGTSIRDLEMIAKTLDLEDFANRIEYLPLK